MLNQLRSARDKRGWSQTRLISELERRARSGSVTVMAPASLRTAISRWENGRVVPDVHYRRLLCDIYGLTDEELGFAQPLARVEIAATTEADLRARIASSSRVDVGLISLLETQTDTIRRLDRRLGAPILLDQMRAHVKTLQQLLTHAVLDSMRLPTARVLADAASLAGWQALDIGLVNHAWSHFELARDAARTSGDAALIAHAKGQQAYALIDLNQPDQALSLVQEARVETVNRLPQRMVSWLWAVEAETAAVAGQDFRCRRALDSAANALPAGPAQDDELPYVSLDSHHLDRWRGSALARLGDREAVDQLSTALCSVDPEYTRATGALHLDLAQALIAADAQDASRVHLEVARQLATQTGSVRQRRRIEQLAA